jgi:hypothetical protein
MTVALESVIILETAALNIDARSTQRVQQCKQTLNPEEIAVWTVENPRRIQFCGGEEQRMIDTKTPPRD